MQKDAVCRCGCRRHMNELAGKPAFSKEISLAQYAQGRFFSGFRYNAELYLPLLDKKQSVRRIALSEYRVLLCKRHHIPTLPNGRKKGAGIEIKSFVFGRGLLSQKAVLTGCLHSQL